VDECKPLVNGLVFLPCLLFVALGKSVTLVERCKLKPVETRVETAWCQRLKLKYDELLSSFGFNFTLRRYPLDHLRHVWLLPLAAVSNITMGALCGAAVVRVLKARPFLHEYEGTISSPMPNVSVSRPKLRPPEPPEPPEGLRIY